MEQYRFLLYSRSFWATPRMEDQRCSTSAMSSLLTFWSQVQGEDMEWPRKGVIESMKSFCGRVSFFHWMSEIRVEKMNVFVPTVSAITSFARLFALQFINNKDFISQIHCLLPPRHAPRYVHGLQPIRDGLLSQHNHHREGKR